MAKFFWVYGVLVYAGISVVCIAVGFPIGLSKNRPELVSVPFLIWNAVLLIGLVTSGLVWGIRKAQGGALAAIMVLLAIIAVLHGVGLTIALIVFGCGIPRLIRYFRT